MIIIIMIIFIHITKLILDFIYFIILTSLFIKRIIIFNFIYPYFMILIIKFKFPIVIYNYVNLYFIIIFI